MQNRKRQQAGQLFKAGGWWYLRYYDSRVLDGELKRVRIAKQLAPVQGTTKSKARDLAVPILDSINKPRRYAPETAVRLSDFVERVYLPRTKEQKRPSTYCGYRDIWENHLRLRCDDLWLREVRTCDVQQILDDAARESILGRNSIKHLKVTLSAVFKFAKQQGYFDGENPVRDTAIPAARESEETFAYSLEEITEILANLPEPAATIFAVAAFTGARRGEIRGLLWEDYRNGEVRISQSIWHSHVTEPKTRRSAGVIPVIAPLAKRLEFHRARLGWPDSGPMFPNAAGKPMDLNNLVNRVMVPVLTRCTHCGNAKGEHTLTDHEFRRDEELPRWHGWHAARRGLGTNLYRLGVPEKTIQAILRHANVSTTTTYYIKTAAEDTQAAMAKLETELIGQRMGNERAGTSESRDPEGGRN
ncbi:MAG TPA: tyrosine-type recombinase/integrase [Candidatus Sulfotelmatobacter sp.]|nr:tyrosine-type recombinase/integrase [Candidatus Sulfotelmatobacter sp.]